MKRSDNLIRLSREHHAALVLAKRARELGNQPGETCSAFMAQLVETFGRELEPHFAIEESHLLPLLQRAGETALVNRTLAEHATLRGLIAEIAKHDHVALIQFGVALAAHVRFEERELFHAAEWVLAPDAMAVARHAAFALQPLSQPHLQPQQSLQGA